MRTHVDLFSGIGGFALAGRWAGVETIAFAEIDSYASRVIERHFTGVRNYGRVQDVPAIDNVWLVTGGVPCQPASVAGKRLGAADDRWLWPEALAAVERIRPAWVLFENPTGILSLNNGLEFERICLALESQGYEVQSIAIPACGVGAPHRRNRVWILAHFASERLATNMLASSPDAIRRRASKSRWRNVQSNGLCGMVGAHTFVPGFGDKGWARAIQSGLPAPVIERRIRGEHGGISRRVDRLRCLGNAIVPQVAYQLIKRMIEAEEATDQQPKANDRDGW